MRTHSAQFDLDGNGLALLFAALDHRIRNLLITIETAVKQTHSTSVEDYRRHFGHKLQPAQLLEQIMRPHSADGAQVQAAGPDVELEPHLAPALHLVFHELAASASKFGALRSRLGSVKIEWTVRHVPGALATVWVEHSGPQVKHPRHAGFGHDSSRRCCTDTAECGWTSSAQVSLVSCWLTWIGRTRE